MRYSWIKRYCWYFVIGLTAVLIILVAGIFLWSITTLITSGNSILMGLGIVISLIVLIPFIGVLLDGADY